MSRRSSPLNEHSPPNAFVTDQNVAESETQILSAFRISKAASEKDNVRESLLYQRFPHPPHSPPNSGRKRVYIPSAFEAASEENISRKRSQSIFDLAKTPGERGKTERPASLRCALTVSPVYVFTHPQTLLFISCLSLTFTDHVPYRTLHHVATSFVFPPCDSYTTQSTWVPLTVWGEARSLATLALS
ncbi:hypothetical protein DFS33DRAFT_1385584 [Desarmillaria ectypa]|nr:hypothetical protein DFS33DRAFT_1385584 [Desarmillaria ectypa]